MVLGYDICLVIVDIVCRCFADEIDLTGLQVDVALRKYQSFFRMPVSHAFNRHLTLSLSCYVLERFVMTGLVIITGKHVQNLCLTMVRYNKTEDIV